MLHQVEIPALDMPANLRRLHPPFYQPILATIGLLSAAQCVTENRLLDS
jgi:hypothetical protein